jgi:hypothetical protein
VARKLIERYCSQQQPAQHNPGGVLPLEARGATLRTVAPSCDPREGQTLPVQRGYDCLGQWARRTAMFMPPPAARMSSRAALGPAETRFDRTSDVDCLGTTTSLDDDEAIMLQLISRRGCTKIHQAPTEVAARERSSLLPPPPQQQPGRPAMTSALVLSRLLQRSVGRAPVGDLPKTLAHARCSGCGTSARYVPQEHHGKVVVKRGTAGL